LNLLVEDVYGQPERRSFFAGVGARRFEAEIHITIQV